ncbi:hypothetical protein VB780_24110 [Leptolyngbya sp. CCNP1308]|uniref:hypothetical protein n=1 Tax=Leptolyngbya sp. CCNP1308 TaxID=3110255 RepID=UPI002B214822|nr:hypothetical protein [Leptolyngbya sp. CCNP1308]MEA5451682.1 hypothetical protein [Leptolyngbya sp. CCNP1308]
MGHPLLRTLALGIAGAQTIIGLSLFSDLLPGLWPDGMAYANQSYPTQADFEFQEEDLALAAEGFQTIYVDALGNVLGTFVTVPGARLKVYANGQIAIDRRDFTTEVTTFSDGRIRAVGEARFEYFSNGRVSNINGIRFSYFNSGRLQSIGDVRFSYFSRGQLQSIDDVFFDYERSGVIRSISQIQTSDGIRIVVVQ